MVNDISRSNTRISHRLSLYSSAPMSRRRSALVRPLSACASGSCTWMSLRAAQQTASIDTLRLTHGSQQQ